MITHKSLLYEEKVPVFHKFIRQAMVANAVSVIGVEAGNKETRPIFDKLLGEGLWGLDKPYGQGGPSTCSMVALGLLRRLMVDSDAVLGKYQIGSGLNVARNYAKTCDAWIKPKGDMVPHPGDVIDLKSAKGAKDQSNHTEVVLGFHGNMLCCVAGGQVARDGLQAIKLVRRVWEVKGSTCYAGAREVDGWIDLTGLRFREDQKMTVPEWWNEVDFDHVLVEVLGL